MSIAAGPRLKLVEDAAFEVTVLVADDLLLLTVRVPSGASRDAIERCLLRIESALASAEQVSERELTGLVWEQRRINNRAVSLVTRRAFSDPTYLKKFDEALHRCDEPRGTAAIH